MERTAHLPRCPRCGHRYCRCPSWGTYLSFLVGALLLVAAWWAIGWMIWG